MTEPNWERVPLTFELKYPETHIKREQDAPIPYTPTAPSPLHVMKGNVILDYARRYDLDLFVETGSCYGEMIEYVRGKFSKIYSIELGDGLFRVCWDKFGLAKDVKLIHGDSTIELPKIVSELNRPALFWLDAHYSGGATAKGAKDTPVMEELAAIYQTNGAGHVVLVDDLGQFGSDPAYPTREELTRHVLSVYPGASVTGLPEGILAITPGGMHKVKYPLSPTCQIESLSAIYKKYFDGKTDGIFVDVGANDGLFCSNTWGLAQVGWRGLCFEPVPELAEKCRKEYIHLPNVQVEEIAVGRKNGEAKLYLNGNSTINEETVTTKAWGYEYDLDNTIIVPLVSLNTSLRKHHIPNEFDVLSIDVEGAELEVLDGIDFKIWKPAMVIIEACKNHPIHSYRLHTDTIILRMLKSGFTEIYADEINSIYVR